TGPGAPERAPALLAAARVCFWQGDYVAARDFCSGALELFQRSARDVDGGWALTLLGSIHGYLGEYPAGRVRFAEAMTVTRNQVVRMEALVGLGEMLVQSGELAEARDRLEACLRLVRGPEGPRGRAALFLGIVAVLEGDAASARLQLAWGLEIFRRLGNLYA